MNKRLFSLCIALAAVTVSAMAETFYGIYVGNVEVSSDNCTDVTGPTIEAYSSSINGGKPFVKFDPIEHTLTLWNVKIVGTGDFKKFRSIYNKSYSNLKVVLRGINSFKGAGVSPLRFEKTTSIIGEKDGSGNMRTIIEGGSEDAVTVKGSDITLNISNADLSIQSQSTCFESDGTTPSLVIVNSTIEATCTANNSGDDYALKNFKNLTVNDSYVTLRGYSQSQAVYGLTSNTLGTNMGIIIPNVGTGLGSFNSSKKTFVDSNAQVVKTVRICKKLSIDSTNFPDEGFRNFLRGETYGQDGYLTADELLSVKSMSVSGQECKNLTGIEHFNKLTSLQCQHIGLTSLDVSKNTDLTYLDCYYNSLTSLDVSKNTALTTLICDCNSLTSLVVSQDMKLTKLVCARNTIIGAKMAELINSLPTRARNDGIIMVCYDDSDSPANEITPAQVQTAKGKGWKVQTISGTAYAGAPGWEINATNFPDAVFRQDVYAHDQYKDNYLTEREVKEIWWISVSYDAKNVTGIEILTELKSLVCSSSKLTSLDVSKNTKLRQLHCDHTKISGIAMTNLINSLPNRPSDDRGSLYVDYTIITTVQVQKAREKGWIVYDCKPGGGEYDGAPGWEINSTNFPDAKFRAVVAASDIDTDRDGFLRETEAELVLVLNLDGKNISNLTGIEYFTELSKLRCCENNLTSLDVSKNTKLQELYCYRNRLTTLNVKNTAVKTLMCYGNRISGRNMTNFVKSLPTWSGNDGNLYVCDDNVSPDNVIIAAQVNTAKNKGWNVKKYSNVYKPYAGQGDVNGDDNINKNDLNVIVKIIMGEMPSGIQELAGDVNNDGKVDAADIVKMVDILNGN